MLRIIPNQMALLTLLAAIIAYFYPGTFLLFKPFFLELFAATMFALGVVLQRDELNITLREPKQIALGVVTQYLIMPLLAFIIVTLAGLPPALALGFIIVGSAPGAMASNVIVYLAGGVMAFSIALTTVATFLAPWLTPALVKLFAAADMQIDFLKLMWTIIYILVIPLSGGILLRYYLDKGCRLRFGGIHLVVGAVFLFVFSHYAGKLLWQNILAGMFILVLPMAGLLIPRRYDRHAIDWAKLIAPNIAALSIIIICAFAVAQNHNQFANPQLHGQILLVFLLVVLLNALGYISGWFLGKLYGFDPRHQLTLSIEIGMQNAGMGVALAIAQFSNTPETALPGAFFAVWCIVTAAAATAWLRRRDKSRNNFAAQP